MRLALRSIHQMAALLGWSLFCWSGLDSTHAADIQWDGSGSPPLGSNSTSWQNVDNWAPFNSGIFVVHRVPGDGDTATLLSPLFDNVILFANTAPINGLIISNGILFSTNQFLLEVDNAGVATTAIAGGATLNVWERTGGPALVTDNLFLSGSGQLILHGRSVSIVEGNTTLVTGSDIRDVDLLNVVNGEIDFGGDLTIDDATLQLNHRLARFSPNSTVRVSSGGLIRLTQQLSIGSGMLFEIEDGSELRVTGNTTVGPTGTLNIEDSTFSSFGNVTINGGTMSVAGSQGVASLVLHAGGALTARNGGQLQLPFAHTIENDQIYKVELGADVVAASALVVGGPSGGAELIVDGVGSTLDIEELQVGSSSPGMAQVTLRNGASATMNNLLIDAFYTPSDPDLVQASVTIEQNASIHLNTGLSSISIGTSGAPFGSIGRLTIRSGGSLDQSSAFVNENRLGTAAASQGILEVSDGGTYSTGAQPFDIRALGSLFVSGGAEAGVVNINGPLDVSGKVFISASSVMPNDPGGILHVNASMTIDGGQVNLSGGVLTAHSVSFANAGVLNFTGGRLSVGVFNGNLTNAGGTLAPGSSAGDMTIIGNYTQQASGTLELELGGAGMGTQYDFVDVTGNAILDGELELALIDGFIPSTAQVFTVFNAANLLGIFDNITNGGRLDTTDGGGSFKVNYGVSSAFNPDQIVLSDFQLVASADLDGDGDVDGRDFLLIQRTNPALIPLWQSQYGSGVSPLASSQEVPEPTTLLLTMLALSITLSRRKLS